LNATSGKGELGRLAPDAALQQRGIGFFLVFSNSRRGEDFASAAKPGAGTAVTKHMR
jgi:hypothetical protein